MQQQTLIAGDTLNFTTSVPDYSALDGWVLKHRLAPRSASNSVISLSSVADGDYHRTQASATTTATWAADTYTWASWVEKAGEKYSVDSGLITIKPDPRAVAAGYDGRTLAVRALEDCKAAFATFSSTRGVQRRYKIGDREMEFNSSADIIKQIAFWENEVAKEDIAAGRRPPFSGKIFTRL